MTETREKPLLFTWKTLDGFTPRCLHEVYRLRVAVFVVEQTCAYPEIDGADVDALHLTVSDEAGRLAAYLRLIAPDGEEPVKLGRIVVARAWRGTGLGGRLLQAGISKAHELYPASPVFLSAQAHLADFYGAHGFSPVSSVYDEDGIPHVDMLRAHLEHERLEPTP